MIKMAKQENNINHLTVRRFECEPTQNKKRLNQRSDGGKAGHSQTQR